jgi:FPC/CPF motif-containing protein YcgG
MIENSEKSFSIDKLIDGKDFPCVAAKSANNTGRISEGMYESLSDSREDRKILEDLDRFIACANQHSGLCSFVASFQGPAGLSELEFETAMWDRLQGLHNIDFTTHGWDERVSSDPASSSFSFSLRGHAFFIIGLNPNASRLSRRYERPALVFNLHEQFEKLRQGSKYGRMRDVIRKRDEALCGRPNPLLKNFGEASEARQYSGRAVPGSWRCPFHANRPRKP